MELKYKLQSLFEEPIIKYEYIPTGLTNDNYHVITNKGSFVVRLPKHDLDIFDYAFEKSIIDTLDKSTITPLTTYYNTHNGIKITEYIANSATYKPVYLIRATQLIKQLHSLNIKTNKVFDIVETYHSFIVDNPFYDLNPYLPILDAIKDITINSNTRLCHNDLVEGNFIFSDIHDYLIDFEYAMDNHPYFDLMSFITENDIIDHNERDIIYRTYFEDKEYDIELLTLFEKGHHILWCRWAMMMYEQTKNDIYYDIGTLKYKRLISIEM